jgi:hypothetical protein|eukprot:COSAG01_NODE_1397_length_10467_cov_9.010706_11_plen_69_part_00
MPTTSAVGTAEDPLHLLVDFDVERRKFYEHIAHIQEARQRERKLWQARTHTHARRNCHRIYSRPRLPA